MVNLFSVTKGMTGHFDRIFPVDYESGTQNVPLCFLENRDVMEHFGFQIRNQIGARPIKKPMLHDFTVLSHACCLHHNFKV